MPTAWPVLTGSRVELRVLTEEDAGAWRLEEDGKHFVPQGEFYVSKPQVEVGREIRTRRVAWALGGGLRHWGIWTIPGGELAGGIELAPGGVGGIVPLTTLSWVVWREFYRVALVAEAIRLAARWGQDNLGPDLVVALLPDGSPVDEELMDAAGFRFDGPPAPWETGRRRYRFHG